MPLLLVPQQMRLISLTTVTKIFEVWWSDSQEFVNAAKATAEADAFATDSREYLTTFFKVNPKGDTSDMTASLKAVAGFLIDGASVSGSDGKPKLYCDSKWLQRKERGDQAQTEGTGTPRTDENEHPVDIGEYLEYTTRAAQKGNLPSRTEDQKDYLVLEDPAEYCSKSTRNVGATQFITKAATVTLCVNNIKKKQPYARLSDIPKADTEGASINKMQVQGMTLFHELFHLVLGHDPTPDNIETLNQCIKLGSTAEMVPNPENYNFFALACYQAQKNPTYTFSSSVSKKKSGSGDGQQGSSQNPKAKRMGTVYGNEWLKDYRPNKGRLPSYMWVA